MTDTLHRAVTSGLLWLLVAGLLTPVFSAGVVAEHIGNLSPS